MLESLSFLWNSPWFSLCFEILFFSVIYLILRRGLRRQGINQKKIQTFLNICFAGVLFAVCGNELDALKPLISQLVASSGLVAVVVGIAAQETLGNVFSGLMILFTKPYTVGDLVKINQGELIGFVEMIRFRDTVIRTYENNRILVPNAKMNSATIENADWKERQKDNYLELPVSYNVPVEKAIQVIQQAVGMVEGMAEEMVEVRVIRFEESSYVLRTILPSSTSLEGFDKCCTIRQAILSRFQKEGYSLGDFSLNVNMR